MYLIKRKPVLYKNGKVSPAFYYQQIGLGLFIELTMNIDEAKQYKTKAEALKVARQLGSRFEVIKMAPEERS